MGHASQHSGEQKPVILQRYVPESLPGWPTSLSGDLNVSRLRDLYRGCLLWGAVGDALGRPAEGWDPHSLRARYGPHGLHEYVAWHGWTGGPKGTFTDDTQFTLVMAECLVATGGTFDPEDLVRRLLAIPHIRGIGRATARALDALRRGAPWWEAGLAENSAGNGAAMRGAPVGLVHALDPTPTALVQDAILSAVPTHPHPVGVAGAVAVAAGVAWCVRARLAGADRLDLAAFVAFVCAALEGMEPEPTPERKPGGRAVRLVERLRELPDLLTWPDTADVFAHTYNGAFALESVPAALYCFLRSPDEPRQVILTAVNAGYDADTVASMAGNLAGAWRGAIELERTAASWWGDLEDRDRLIALADRLADLAAGTGKRGAEMATGGPEPLARIAGCLLGGAVGDALGAAVEFLSLAEIRRRFGSDGLRDYAPAYGRLGAITDDTQMTLFTAEGLIRADNREREKGICHPPTMVYHAYLRWLETQGERPSYPYPEVRSGWLLEVPDLHHARAPGTTCLAALRSGQMGSLERALNGSKGCGGIMRVAPVGLIGADEPFRLGCELAAITHGHPSGYLSAGFLSHLIHLLFEGQSLERAIQATTDELRRWPQHDECLAAVESAVALAQAGPVTPERLETLGGGWVGEEALAIALACVLAAHGSFERGVLAAVNHSGDSDSTGAIAGNILGVLLGTQAIPAGWLERLELRAEIEQVAADLHTHFRTPDEVGSPPRDWERHPGW